jgi:hypothetical protein
MMRMIWCYVSMLAGLAVFVPLASWQGALQPPMRAGKIAYVADINDPSNPYVRPDIDASLYVVDANGNSDKNELQEVEDLWH